MRKKILIVLSIIVIAVVGFVIYKKVYNPNPSREYILKGIEHKDKIRNELGNVINGIENPSEDYEISISDAKDKAIIIFESLGEKNLNKDNMEATEIKRKGVRYYYITSANNSLEIEINTGRITRINTIVQ